LKARVSEKVPIMVKIDIGYLKDEKLLKQLSKTVLYVIGLLVALIKCQECQPYLKKE